MFKKLFLYQEGYASDHNLNIILLDTLYAMITRQTFYRSEAIYKKGETDKQTNRQIYNKTFIQTDKYTDSRQKNSKHKDGQIERKEESLQYNITF